MPKDLSNDIHAAALAKGWVASKEPFQVKIFQERVLGLSPRVLKSKGWLNAPFTFPVLVQPRKFLAPIQIPSSFDWREKAELAHPWDQRESNMCMAYAICASADARSLISDEPASRFAPRYFHFHYMRKALELGATIYEAAELALKYGLPHAFPGEETITTVEECEDLSPPNKSVVKGVFSFATIEEVKQEIVLRGPVICQVTTYSDFRERYGHNVYRITSKNEPALHAMTIVGYNNDGGYWIIKNSYGAGWGDLGGYCLYSMEDSGLLTPNPTVWAIEL